MILTSQHILVKTQAIAELKAIIGTERDAHQVRKVLAEVPATANAAAMIPTPDLETPPREKTLSRQQARRD